MQTIDFSFSYQSSQALLLYKAFPGAEKGREKAEAPVSPYGGDIVELGKHKDGGIGQETIFAVIEEKVNARIEASFEGQANEAPLQDDYWSPEKTAERIVGFALKFFDKFAEQSGGESEAVLEEYLQIIGGAIDEGFAQARAILGDHGKLTDQNRSTIDATRDRVQSLLDEFRQTVLDRLRDGGAAVDSDESDAGERHDSPVPVTERTIS